MTPEEIEELAIAFAMKWTRDEDIEEGLIAAWEEGAKCAAPKWSEEIKQESAIRVWIHKDDPRCFSFNGGPSDIWIEAVMLPRKSFEELTGLEISP